MPPASSKLKLRHRESCHSFLEKNLSTKNKYKEKNDRREKRRGGCMSLLQEINLWAECIAKQDTFAHRVHYICLTFNQCRPTFSNLFLITQLSLCLTDAASGSTDLSLKLHCDMSVYFYYEKRKRTLNPLEL